MSESNSQIDAVTEVEASLLQTNTAPSSSTNTKSSAVGVAGSRHVMKLPPGAKQNYLSFPDAATTTQILPTVSSTTSITEDNRRSSQSKTAASQQATSDSSRPSSSSNTPSKKVQSVSGAEIRTVSEPSLTVSEGELQQFQNLEATSTPQKHPVTHEGSDGAHSAVSGSGPEASSCHSTPTSGAQQQRPVPQKSRRKKRESYLPKAKAAANQGVMPGGLMLTSATPNQFMLVHHNGQCYMMPAQYISTNQQFNPIKPQQQQQQHQQNQSKVTTQDIVKIIQQQQQLYEANNPQSSSATNPFDKSQRGSAQNSHSPTILPGGIVTSSTTLGQLARTLAPKSRSKLLRTQLQTGINTVPINSQTPISSQQYNTFNNPQGGQTGFVQPGIQLRQTSQGPPGVVFQLPNGGYTYVQQVLSPQQYPALAQQQTKVTNTVDAQQSIINSQNVDANKSSNSSLQERDACADPNKGGVKASTDDESSSSVAKVPGRDSSSPKNAPRSCMKRKEVSKVVRIEPKATIAVPQPIVPNNLVPVGAPMPMMLMSTAMPAFTTSSVVGPNGQFVHQPIVSGQPLTHHQMVSILQQQQNIQRFAAPMIPSAASTAFSTPPSRERTLSKYDDGIMMDSSIENEPPPLLVQGELKDTLDLHDVFTKEAERYRNKVGLKKKIIHLIDGFEIEESSEPFPCEAPCQLDGLSIDLENKAKIKNMSNNDGVPRASIGKVDAEDVDVDKKITTKKKGDKVVKKRPRRRKTNELDRLLQMDFGPAQGRLCDILASKKSISRPKDDVIKKAELSACGDQIVEIEVMESAEAKMEDFVILKSGDDELAFEQQSKLVENAVNSVVAATTTPDATLNSSKESGESVQAKMGFSHSIFSDEELDTERCNYCNGLLRLKRLENHPQYCSKKCRKLWKRNPISIDEPTPRSFNSSPKVCASQRSLTSPALGDFSPSNQSNPIISEPSTSGMTCDAQQRSPPVLTLKVVSPRQAEIVKSPKNATNEMDKIENEIVEPELTNPMQFLNRATRTWTCDEVAKWIASVTGNGEYSKVFTNQDIDGQSLLLLAENAHHNFGSLLGLKLGPVVKIVNALKELASKSVNAL